MPSLTLYCRVLPGPVARERARRLRLFLQLFHASNENLRAGHRRLVVFAHDFIAHQINIDGVFERMELETLFGWLTSHHPEALSGTAVDIGANIGNHSLYFSDHFDRVICFEPNPRTFRVLQLNAELADNITCLKEGISDVERTAYMVTPAGNVGHAHVIDSISPDSSPIVLKTLDQAINTEEPVRLIKIDVEGHEYQALRGAEKTIRKWMPIILFEQLASPLKHGNTNVVELLRSYGYSKFATVSKETHRPRSRTGAIDLLWRAAAKLLPLKSYYLGTEWSVRLCDSFANRDYPFIVAIPEWLDARKRG
jgi:FkbM family methyltransferase